MNFKKYDPQHNITYIIKVTKTHSDVMLVSSGIRVNGNCRNCWNDIV